jgi:hypothetical protein
MFTGWPPTVSSSLPAMRISESRMASKSRRRTLARLLCASICAELGAILRGDKDAVQVLFAGAGTELLDQFYGDGLYTSQ